MKIMQLSPQFDLSGDQTLLGYRQKPRWIFVLSACFALMALFSIYQHALQDTSAGLASEPLRKLPLSIQDLFCPASAALAIFCVSRFSLLYFLALSGYVIFFKITAISTGTGMNSQFEYPVIAFWIAAPALILMTTLRIPYLHPDACWWKRPPRVKHPSLAVLYYGGIKFPVVVMNISAGGVFVKLDERLFLMKDHASDSDRRGDPVVNNPFFNPGELVTAKNEMVRYPEKLGAKVSLSIQVVPGLDCPYPKGFFETEGEVVWMTKVTDPYRYGLGLKFTGQPKRDRTRLKRYLGLVKPSKT